MRFTCTLAALAVAAALASPLASADPVATASKSCSVGDSRSYGTTYVITINVSGTSCRAGRSLIRAYHDCRPGKSGKCPSVKGYSCSEKRTKGATQYDSRVTCTKGDKTVKHVYTQYT
ncbi:MAG: hypothetical protein QOD13_2301 [Thermoleophilaceae bacterium]|jgi:hypothetical protein|nr:hypothetical protein [Thermoleophilaceae bacterium]